MQQLRFIGTIHVCIWFLNTYHVSDTLLQPSPHFSITVAQCSMHPYHAQFTEQKIKDQ